MPRMAVELTLDKSQLEYLGAQLTEQIQETPQFRPAKIVITAPYAQYVEFGTHAAEKKGEEGENSAKENIRRWAEIKFKGLKSKKDLDRFVHDVYYYIMKNGTIPHPFITPTLEEFFDSEEFQHWFIEGNSIMGMALTLQDRMKDRLNNPDGVFLSSNTTNGLIDSFEVTYADESDFVGTDNEEWERRYQEALDKKEMMRR